LKVSEFEGAAVFERFTETACEAVLLAQDEARQLGHNLLGTEFILLGLLRVNEDITNVVLTRFGATLSGARQQVEQSVGRGPGAAGEEIPWTPNANELLERAWTSTKELGDKHIGTEHLLLGMIKMGSDCVAVTVLLQLGIPTLELEKLLRQFLPLPADAWRVHTGEGDATIREAADLRRRVRLWQHIAAVAGKHGLDDVLREALDRKQSYERNLSSSEKVI